LQKKEIVDAKVMSGMLLLLVAVSLFNRAWATWNYNLPVIDIDESLMLYALHEMAGLRFHEPAFYGQTYNSVFEALVAVPFSWAGIQAPAALVFATAFLALFPFLLLAFLFDKNDRPEAAVGVMAISLVCSPEFDWVTGMPRGFVTGVFFSSLLFPALFRPGGVNWLLCGFGLGLTMLTTPNALLFAVPLMLVVCWRHWRSARFYASVLAGLFPAFFFWIYIDHFYSQHPEYLVYQAVPMMVSWDNFARGITMLDRLLGDAIPLVWYQGTVAAVLPVLLMFIGFSRKNTSLFLYAGGVLFIMLAALAMERTYNGNTSVHYAYMRIYLALPMAICLLFSFIRVPRVGVLGLAGAGLLLVGYKVAVSSQTVLRHADKLNWEAEGPVYPGSLERVTEICEIIHQLELEHSAEVTFVGPGFVENHLNITYGCKPIVPAMNELFANGDRRRWLVDRLGERRYDKILFVSTEPHELFAPERFGRFEHVKVHGNPDVYLVSGEDIDLVEELQASGFLQL
jgi:hypothetical protein